MLSLLAVAAVLLAIGVVLFMTAGDDGSRPTGTPTPTGSTPDSLDPTAPTQSPDVSGRRTADGVVFSWSSSEGSLPGDTWQWHRPDTGEDQRTTETSLTVVADDRVCLDVRLIRSGFASPWGNECVD
jgi:hypothetical protein